MAFYDLAWCAIAAAAILYGFAEVLSANWWIPTRHWQVPGRWAALPVPWGDIIFGLNLGVGFLTIIPFVGYHLLAAICIMLASPRRAAMIMAIYGATRAAPLILVPVVSWLQRGTYSSTIAAEANSWLAGFDPRMRWTRAAVLLAVAASALSLT